MAIIIFGIVIVLFVDFVGGAVAGAIAIVIAIKARCKLDVA